jgi:hypothetical protein
MRSTHASPGPSTRPRRHQSALPWLIATLAILLSPPSTASSRADDPWSVYGPLFSQYPLTLNQGTRTEAIGPLFRYDATDSRQTWVIPPFARTTDADTDSAGWDFIYPLVTYDRFGPEYRFQILQWLAWAGGKTPQEDAVRRFTLFPIYWQQRSADTNQNYTAVFPFYGELKNRLFRDKIIFAMFPGYMHSWKKDVETYTYLFPVVHFRYGDGLYGWQVWPLVGHEQKEPTTVTNGWGETVSVPGHDNKFLLWPLLLSSRSGIGSDNPQEQKALIPLFGYTRSPRRDSTSVLVFFMYLNDREKKYRSWDMPWPFIEFSRGEGKTMDRVFPFYSHGMNTNLESGFILWPVYKYNRLSSGPLYRERNRVLFFVYDDILQRNMETGAEQRQRLLLPLYSWRKDFNGNTRLQILSLLEPFFPFNESIQRDYSQLWTLWLSEKNPRTGARSQTLLWNLYRHETTPDSKRFSALFGLFQYQSGPGGKRLRLFYIPVMKTRSPPESAPLGHEPGETDLSFDPPTTK